MMLSPHSTFSLSLKSAVPGSSASASLLPEENLDPDAGKSERQVRDEILGQLNLFPDDI